MNIGITGATGFVGSHLAAQAKAQGHGVTGFSRHPRAGFRKISPDQLPDLSGLDAVINLAGESIFGLWTKAKKSRIRESRVHLTRQLVQAMECGPRPQVLVNASAIGYYGDTGENLVDENSAMGDGFLAEVCRDWEAEALRAEAFGVRVVCVRFGLVLGRGGMVKVIRPLFALGLGGPLGDGRQWMSGIHVEDVAGICLWAMERDSLRGPVNAVLPEPFRNSEFTREMGAALHRPAFLPAPAFMLRTALGELSHLMLDSNRVAPARTLAEGYQFRFPTLPETLRQIIGR